MAKIGGFLLLVIMASNCAGSKEMDFEQTPPFQLASAYTQKWVAGIPGGGSGTHIHIHLKNVMEAIRVQNVYFQGKVAKLTQDPNQPNHYFANAKGELNREVIMDSDPVQESQNIPPKKVPFHLANDEMVISYTLEGDQKYYKITQVEAKPMLAYPSIPPSGIEE